jgi:hypothetical protein
MYKQGFRLIDDDKLIAACWGSRSWLLLQREFTHTNQLTPKCSQKKIAFHGRTLDIFTPARLLMR